MRQIFIDNQHIGNDDDLAALVNSGKINELLNTQELEEICLASSFKKRKSLVSRHESLLA